MQHLPKKSAGAVFMPNLQKQKHKKFASLSRQQVTASTL